MSLTLLSPAANACAPAGPSPGAPWVDSSPMPKMGYSPPAPPLTVICQPHFLKVANLQHTLHLLSLPLPKCLTRYLDEGTDQHTLNGCVCAHAVSPLNHEAPQLRTPAHQDHSWFPDFAHTLPLPWVPSHTADLVQGLTMTPSSPSSPLPAPAPAISVSSTICPTHSLS